jgi:prevent-host-death family protein
MSGSGVHRTSSALLGFEQTLGIDPSLERRPEGLPGGCGRLARVVGRVESVCTDPSAKGPTGPFCLVHLMVPCPYLFRCPAVRRSLQPCWVRKRSCGRRACLVSLRRSARASRGAGSEGVARNNLTLRPQQLVFKHIAYDMVYMSHLAGRCTLICTHWVQRPKTRIGENVMTVSGVLQAMGMRELRTNLRAVVERVEAGTPVVCLKDGQPVAVVLAHEEAERWRKVEDSLATLHAMNIYPEALNDPSELADLASMVPPGLATIRRLTSEPRAILSPLRTVGVSDARAAFATLVGDVAQGRVRTIVAKGHLAVAVIPAPEYDRLRALNRAVSWFRGAGLDLATATEQQIIDFIQARRGQTGGAQQQSAG